MNKKILVTGASGHLGGMLFNSLSAIGYKNLIGTDLKKQNIEKNQKFNFDGIVFNVISENTIKIVYEKNSHKLEEILNFFKKNDLKILDIATEDGDLEDVFLQLTNN